MKVSTKDEEPSLPAKREPRLPLKPQIDLDAVAIES